MKYASNHSFSAFLGPDLVVSGPVSKVAVALRRQGEKKPDLMPLVFDDDTGNLVELDLRGTPSEVAARYPDASPSDQVVTAADRLTPASRGRPRLGVVGREVTLLPEHWEWLASQPGGASVALRKLVHEARQANVERDQRRRTEERAYKVMVALAGNLPGFEEASRALFAGEPDRLLKSAKVWPPDIRDYILRLSIPKPMQSAGRS